jgi:hypothetical protein
MSMSRSVDHPHPFRVAVGTVVVLLVVAAVVVGGWQLGWWIKGASTNRNANIARHNDGRQIAYVAQARNLDTVLAGIDVQVRQSPDQAAVLTAQRLDIRNRFCAVANTVDDVPSDLAADMAREGC